HVLRNNVRMLTTFGQARAIQDRASLARGLALLVAAVP
ncbi:MAG: hypothetical protein QOH31_3918, partial [Verrucomicrobiota bacterium]